MATTEPRRFDWTQQDGAGGYWESEAGYVEEGLPGEWYAFPNINADERLRLRGPYPSCERAMQVNYRRLPRRLLERDARMSNQPPERRCACKSWDAAECLRLRTKAPNGWGDLEDLYREPAEECECSCHDEWRDWCDDDD